MRVSVPVFALVLFSLILAKPQTVLAQSGPNGPRSQGIAKTSPHTTPPLSPTDQEQVVAYWTSETRWKSELQLRNNVVSHRISIRGNRFRDGGSKIIYGSKSLDVGRTETPAAMA